VTTKLKRTEDITYSKPVIKSHFSRVTPGGILAAIIISGITINIEKIPLHTESTTTSFSGRFDESEHSAERPMTTALRVTAMRLMKISANSPTGVNFFWSGEKIAEIPERRKASELFRTKML